MHWQAIFILIFMIFSFKNQEFIPTAFKVVKSRQKERKEERNKNRTKAREMYSRYLT